MKLLRLDLLAVGPFTDQTLDFSAGDCGLHMVFGPNEAGKSSSLMALRALLYGFPGQTDQNFEHAYKRLRVGGLFQGADGQQFAGIRRKGNKETLRDGNDAEPIEEATLRTMLAGVEEEQFCQRFGINHDQLRAGCESLRAGEGDLAEALFSAGAGLGDVHKVIEAVRAEATEIYKTSGKKQKLPEALAVHAAAEKELTECMESAPEWKQKEEHLARLRTELTQLEEEIGESSRRSERLARIKIALPEISQREHLKYTVEGLQQVPLLSGDFSERRVSAMTQLEQARRSHGELQKSIAKLEAELAEYEEESPELLREAEISQLYRGSDTIRTGQIDRPALATRLQQHEAQSRHLLRELGHGELEFETADRLHIDKLTRDHIQKLALEHNTLDSQRQQLEAQASEVAAELEQLEQEQIAEEPPSTEALAELVAEIRSAGDLQRQLSVATADNLNVEQELSNRLRRFTPWEGDLPQLAKTPVPSKETIRRHEQQIDEAAAQVRSHRDKLREVEHALEEIEGEIASLSLQHDVPTEEDLALAREARQLSWQVVRSRWLGESLPPATEAPEDDTQLAGQLETQSEAADSMSDRLRREAEQVAQKADKLTAREKLIGQQARLTEQVAEAMHTSEHQLADWEQAWSSVGIEPATPREMLDWLTVRDALVAAAEAHGREVAHAGRLEEEIASLEKRLVAAIKLVDATAAANHEGLGALLREADALVKRLETQRQRHQQLLRDSRQAKANLRKHQQKLTQLRQQCEAADKAWRAELDQFDIPPAASADQATGLLDTLDRFFQHRREADELAGRIEGIDQRAAEFEQESRALAGEIEPGLLELAPTKLAEQLHQRVALAKQRSHEQENLRKQLQNERQRLEAAAVQIQHNEADLTVLCQEARCESPEQLPQVAESSGERRQAEKDLTQIEMHLAGLAQGVSLEEFIAQTSAEAADQLPSEIERLETTQKNLGTQRDERLQQINSLEKEIRGLTGGDRAALAAENVKAELANLSAMAEDYARLKLAESVLLRAMQRYRQQNQGPILQRASEYFSLLTTGSFSHLQPEWNEEGEAVLVGVRADSSAKVLIDGMSSGTMDQLYLALRLASLEHHIEERRNKGLEPLPLVVDDILIHFDNARSAAALEALAEVSKQTQVIMFTHHRHLIRLAQETLDDQTLFVQELASPVVAGKQQKLAL